MLLRSILCGGAWNGFLFGKTKEEEIPCRFCGGVDRDGHLFWECSSPSLVHVREHPEFVPLMSLDRSTWPRCLAWHGWLPTLTCLRAQPPWAVAEVDSVDAALETALGAYPICPGGDWNPGWDPEDIVDLTDNVPNHPNIWTDGSRDEDLDAMVGVAGSGAFVKDVPWVFDGRAWVHAQDLDIGEDASRIFLWFLDHFKRSSVLNTGVLFLLCRLSCRSILALITKMYVIEKGEFLLAGMVLLFRSALMVTFLAAFLI